MTGWTRIQIAMAVCVSVVLSSGSAWADGASPVPPVFHDGFIFNPDPAWGNQRGNWAVSGGKYWATQPGNNPSAYTDVTTLPELRDFAVDVGVNNVNDGGIWLRSHYNDGNVTGVLLVTGGNGAGYRSGLSTNTLYWHIVNGTSNSSNAQELNSVVIPGLAGSNADIYVSVNGDTYSAYVNGVLATTLTTNAFTSGSTGLYAFGNQESFSSFAVWAVPVPEPEIWVGLSLGLAILAARRKRVAPQLHSSP